MRSTLRPFSVAVGVAVVGIAAPIASARAGVVRCGSGYSWLQHGYVRGFQHRISFHVRDIRAIDVRSHQFGVNEPACLTASEIAFRVTYALDHDPPHAVRFVALDPAGERWNVVERQLPYTVAVTATRGRQRVTMTLDRPAAI